MPAFKALVTEGKVKEVMCAYNRFEGEPCCSNKTLLINILKDESGDSMMLSFPIAELLPIFYTKGRHETHASAADASADAVMSEQILECRRFLLGFG